MLELIVITIKTVEARAYRSDPDNAGMVFINRTNGVAAQAVRVFWIV